MQNKLINFWRWTGFGNKTLWDFLPQLIAVLTVITAFLTFNFQQEESNKRSQKEELTKYFSDMKELLLEKENLLDNQRPNKVQNLARVKTINTLEQLDEENKRILLSFLIEANLVNNVNNSNSSSRGNSLSGSNLIISLSKANLVKIKLPRVDLSGADLSGADLSGADLSGADLSRADLSGADLSGANLTKTRLTKASLRYAELKGAKLENTNLTEARLREANLTKANLKNSDLSKASLVGANLEKVNLIEANLEKTDLIGANLRKADLTKANLREADVLGTEVAEANFEDVQEANSLKHLSRNQLNSAKNLKINTNLPNNPITQNQEGFSCGPYTDTYAVRSITEPAKIVGVRCLLKINVDTKLNKNKIPTFVWYGEGKSNKGEYRHIGQAFYKNSILDVAYILELDGSNKNQKTPSPSKVEMTIPPEKKTKNKADSVSEFQVKDKNAVIEKWTLEKQRINYAPLNQPTSRFNCGEKFIKYKVYPIVTRRRIINSTNSEQSVSTDWGLRCVYEQNQTITWFGTGQWEGKPYYHLGTKMIDDKDVKKGYGAVDLCYFQKKAYCYKVEGGFLELNRLKYNDFEIKREWSEKWLK
jgi:uncharacterized protein YjbI with pentapeptide repeats